MITHDLIQGSAAWLEYRSKHFNASDAPAMLGCSAYKSRSALIAELATGLTAEVDSFMQKRFDDGHRYEALARPLAEAIIGEDLYPVTGSEGKYSASFDGLTLGEDTGFEHKSLNDELRAIMGGDCIGSDLPKMYRVQMEQQCMVSGAGHILFMASRWVGEELVEEYHCWYEPDAELRAEIIAGWAQLEADVAAYVPPEAVSKPVAEAIDTLPAIAVQIEGRVVASNIPAFRECLAVFIAGVNTNLVTDQDFANADAAVKKCTETETRLAATKEQVLGQVASIDEVIRALDDADEQISKLRIHLEKEIKAKKELLKAGILSKVQQAFKDHVATLEKEIAPLTLVFQARDFAGVMKNKRTLETLQNAVDTELAAGKITVDAIAAAVRARHAWFKEVAADYVGLFADLQTLIQKADDDFKLVVNTRIDKQKADDEAKLEADRKRQAELAAQVAEPVQAAAPVVLGVDMATPGSDKTVEVSFAGGLVTFKADADPALIEVLDTTPAGPPTLKLGEISTRLGFTVTADFLASLGYTPAATEKNSKLFHEGQFKLICGAIIKHVTAVANQF